MTPLRVLVTGARLVSPAGAALVESALTRVTAGARGSDRPVIVVEGMCPYGGVDEVARHWADAAPGVTVETHQPYKLTAQEFRARNQRMVDAGADVCLAFPAPDSTGTWDCLRRAAKAGIPGRVYPLSTWIKGEPT